MLFLIFLHFIQDSLCVRAPAGEPVSVTQHRTAIGFVLTVNLLVYFGRFLNSTKRDINDAVHVFSAGQVRLVRCQPVETRVSLTKLASLILYPTVVQEGRARKWIALHCKF